MIIDAHAHIYPDKIAKKATEAIGDFYDIPMEDAGTTSRLLAEGKDAGIDMFIVHSCATKASQVHAINEFIKEEADKHSEFIPFMTLHEDMTLEEMEKEVSWCKQNGFKGIKLHPDFQRFYIDDESAEKFYKVAGDKLPILLHVGDDRYEYSKPKRLFKMAKKYPMVNFIAAHFGGYRCWDDIDVYLGLDNVYYDTCSSLAFISTKKAREIIDKLGVDKFFFATDFPMWEAKGELERFYQIPMTENEREKVLSLNVRKLLKI